MTAQPPSMYLPGFARAQHLDPVLANNYVLHTRIGDPVMDAIIKELATLPPREVPRLIRAGMEQEEDVLHDAPPLFREFFTETCLNDPPWLDHDAFVPGIRAFHANVTDILAGFVAGVLVDGFSTLIAKSFVATGRVIDAGTRRLQQNNRHLVEIFFPGGLDRVGDGWKLSVRIRIIHARVRHLLDQSGDWDREVWGIPISAAHLGYAAACFSARTLEHSQTLGAVYSKEERESFCAVWRYAAWLMGIPETILFTNESEALTMHELGSRIEPPPTIDSILMANALINSAPLVAGITDEGDRKKLVNQIIYPVSRALIGGRLADQLQYPKAGTLESKLRLFLFRFNNKYKKYLAWARRQGGDNMMAMFSAALYEEMGIRYELPDNVHSELSSSW